MAQPTANKNDLLRANQNFVRELRAFQNTRSLPHGEIYNDKQKIRFRELSNSDTDITPPPTKSKTPTTCGPNTSSQAAKVNEAVDTVCLSLRACKPTEYYPSGTQVFLNPLHNRFLNAANTKILKSYFDASKSNQTPQLKPNANISSSEMTQISHSKNLVEKKGKFTKQFSEKRLKLCRDFLFKLCVDEDLYPTFNYKTSEIWQSLRSYLKSKNKILSNLPQKCPPEIEIYIQRMEVYKKIFNEGIHWQDDGETISNIKKDQIFRGVSQFDRLTINGNEFSFHVNEQETTLFDETISHDFEELPPSLQKFYLNLFLKFQEYHLNFPNGNTTLKNILKQTSTPEDNAAYHLLFLSNLSMWGKCHLVYVNNLYGIFNNPNYRIIHNRNGSINQGVEMATTCDMEISKDESIVTQNKIYQASLKWTNKPIANFTIVWKSYLPTSSRPCEAYLKIKDFSWCLDVTEEEKMQFLENFINFLDEHKPYVHVPKSN